MENQLDLVLSFLRDYERNIAAADIPALLDQFADPFLAAIPQGVKIVSAADHAKELPARRNLFDRAGCKPGRLVSAHPITLSSRYVLALTKWRWAFAAAHAEAKEILTDAAFLVDTGAGPPKIVLYLPATDMVAALKEEGIPAG